MTKELLAKVEKELEDKLDWYLENSSNHDRVFIAVQIKQLHVLKKIEKHLSDERAEHTAHATHDATPHVKKVK